MRLRTCKSNQSSGEVAAAASLGQHSCKPWARQIDPNADCLSESSGELLTNEDA